MKEQEVFSPDISKPTDVIFRKKSEKISNIIIKDETDISQKRIDNLVSNIQDKINSGEISLKDGNARIDKIISDENEKLKDKIKSRYDKEIKIAISSKEFQTKISEADKFRSTFKTSFSPEYKWDRTMGRLELGADITAGVVSGIVPPLGIAYFAGKGCSSGSGLLSYLQEGGLPQGSLCSWRG